MKYIPIHGLEKSISQVILGTMSFSPSRMDYVTEMLGVFFECGGNTVDTAHVYNRGESEKAIGLWLQETGKREDMIIIDKGAHPDENGPRVTPEAISEDLEESLSRLQTDYIDIYMLHRDNPDVPVGVIIESLNEHYKAGRICALGVSNWTNERIDEANKYAQDNGLVGFTVNSPNLSLAKPNEPMWPGCISVDEQSLNWHISNQMPLLSWSSQAGGFFTGRFSQDKPVNKDMVRVYYSDENWERYHRAEMLAQEKGVDTNQIALAYVLNQPFPTCALIGPQRISELHSSLKALDIELSDEQIRWLDLRK
ncbi:aldo/keto reductase [Aquibacillus albus]|uniref:Aryl-alcohol dehydrogenase-like predicted oxidoreductase n=1 Tax=Aquibacillus albus TaxID=1168171 RepID=A0ABS2MWQ7_9BACI|nr:aldo/keto reductase [Aquibacillus albus]MBM7570317.1 aryl-alcohol dehydrogenase-like predicted oxidoreductase [Aquibacillus albus]